MPSVAIRQWPSGPTEEESVGVRDVEGQLLAGQPVGVGRRILGRLREADAEVVPEPRQLCFRPGQQPEPDAGHAPERPQAGRRVAPRIRADLEEHDPVGQPRGGERALHRRRTRRSSAGRPRGRGSGTAQRTTTFPRNAASVVRRPCSSRSGRSGSPGRARRPPASARTSPSRPRPVSPRPHRAGGSDAEPGDRPPPPREPQTRRAGAVTRSWPSLLRAPLDDQRVPHPGGVVPGHGAQQPVLARLGAEGEAHRSALRRPHVRLRRGRALRSPASDASRSASSTRARPSRCAAAPPRSGSDVDRPARGDGDHQPPLGVAVEVEARVGVRQRGDERQVGGMVRASSSPSGPAASLLRQALRPASSTTRPQLRRVPNLPVPTSVHDCPPTSVSGRHFEPSLTRGAPPRPPPGRS